MNLFPPLLVLADKMVLAGGQVPLAWQRMIATREVWLKEWHEVATWVEAWSWPRPAMREGSLFGPALSLLTVEGDAARTADLPAEAAEPRPMRSKWSDDDNVNRAAEATGSRSMRTKWPGLQPGHDRDQTPDGGENAALSPLGMKKWAKMADQEQLMQPTAGHPRPLLGNFAPQASRALLNGLAGTAVPTGGSSQPQGHRLMQPQADKANVKAPVPTDPAAGKHWLRTAAKRSAGVFRSNAAPISAQEPASRSSSGGSSLPEPWATAVTGQPAPQAVLAQLASVMLVGNSAADDQRKLGAGSSPRFAEIESGGPGDAAQQGTRSPQSPSGNYLKERSKFESGGQQPDHPDSAQPEIGKQMASPLNANLQTNGGYGGQREHAPVIPPSAAPSLPTLRPPLYNREAMVPVASSMIRQDVRQDKEADGQDDLVELSAKIKRILDEEARRYGIDV